MMVSCVSSYMSTSFEGVDYLQEQKIWAKSINCKKFMPLERTKHVETYGAHSHKHNKVNA